MESNPVTTAKSTTAAKSPSAKKIENTPVTTAEDTNGDSLSLVAGAEPVIDAWKKMENKPVTVVEVSDDSSSVKVANKDCPEIQKGKMESKPVIVAKATSDYSQGKMESNPVTTAKSTTAAKSPSAKKIENTPVTTAEATNGDSLSPVARVVLVPSGRAEFQGDHSPSFERSNRGWIRDTMEFSVSGNIVIITPRASGGEKKPKNEDDEEIPEELAVCKFCFDIFAEENVLKTKCNCKTALIHEKCASHHFNELGNNMCGVCDQEVETISVTLLRRPFSMKTEKQKSKKHWFGWRMKRPVR